MVLMQTPLQKQRQRLNQRMERKSKSKQRTARQLQKAVSSKTGTGLLIEATAMRRGFFEKIDEQVVK